MKKILFLFLAAGSLTVSAQKNLSLQETVYGRLTLSPSSLSQWQWIKGTTDYSWVRPNADGVEELVKSSGDGKKVTVIITLTELNAKISGMAQTALGPEKKFPMIHWISSNAFEYDNEDLTVTYDVSAKKISTKKHEPFPKEAENFDEAKSGHTAYTVDNNLYVMMNGKPVPVTQDNDPNIVNGKSVHREEFGIYKGTFWSPSGSLLAFYRMDQTMVTDYPIMEIGKQPAAARMIKYPMAGGRSHEVTIGVYNTATGKTVFLKTGEPKEQYLTNVEWSPDNQYIYVAVLNRDQNHMKFNRYNASTGEFDKTLFEEKDEKYVQPLNPMMFVTGKPNQFIWQSEKEGMNAIYLYDVSGKMINRLTPVGDKGLIVTHVYGFDKKGNMLYFQAAPFGSIDRVIYSVNITKGEISVKSLTALNGTSNATFSDDWTQFLNDYSSNTTPRVQSVITSEGKVKGAVNTASNPLTGYNQCQIKLFQIKAADEKTLLWCRMILPPGFDSTKKYRSLTYVYNGPNAQMISNTWMGGADFFLYYMAQNDFIVFTVDGRGSENRGKEFEQVTFRNLGKEEIADQKKGAEYLKSLRYIDGNRMAVYGWSFGGFMTTSLMTRTPGLYQCGVAGGAVIDWSYYEIMYTERYMDTPQQNPEGYKESSLPQYVNRLKGKLLEIHGTSDDVVVWQHTLLYTKAAVEKGVQIDYFMYPGHLHNVRGKDRIHMNQKIAEYVMQNT